MPDTGAEFFVSTIPPVLYSNGHTSTHFVLYEVITEFHIFFEQFKKSI
jgi:hypothetical protein